MSEIVRTNNNLPLSIDQFKNLLDHTQVQSVGVVNTKLSLLDYERYFRENYLVRFNKVSTKYESAQHITGVDGEQDSVEWIELNQAELHSDLIRAGAKGRGQLSDGEVARMLSDRRLVTEYDPILGYFRSLESYLDGADNYSYIDDLASCVKVEGDEDEQLRWRTSFKKVLVRTVKCALNDNYFNKQCLTLYSKDQNLGKTSFLRFLTPPPLKKYYYEGAIGGDKDSQTVLTKNFIILIDELANLSKLDINVLKAIISKLSVNIRLPYEKNFQEFPRRASFFATTNRTDFLTDDTNSRWLIFDVKHIDRRYGDIFTGQYNIDINSVWAEAFRLYKENYNCELSKDDLAINEEKNVIFSAESLEEEVLNSYFVCANVEDKHKEGFKKMTSGDIYELACTYLEAEGKEHKLKALNQKYFFNTLAKKWKRTSIRLENKVVSGYYLLDLKCIKNNNNEQLPF